MSKEQKVTQIKLQYLTIRDPEHYLIYSNSYCCPDCGTKGHLSDGRYYVAFLLSLEDSLQSYFKHVPCLCNSQNLISKRCSKHLYKERENPDNGLGFLLKFERYCNSTFLTLVNKIAFLFFRYSGEGLFFLICLNKNLFIQNKNTKYLL